MALWAFGPSGSPNGKDNVMASFDYGVLIVGSGFGGSVAALRAAEKGYRVGVMESGRRWNDEEIPKSQWDLPRFLWQPEAEMYGIQRISYLDDVLILSGAAVGGGSHVYANTLYVPPKQFFDAREWAGITDPTDNGRPIQRKPTSLRDPGPLRRPASETRSPGPAVFCRPAPAATDSFQRHRAAPFSLPRTVSAVSIP
jgi:choline dehydrogenase-like flavoprotein